MGASRSARIIALLVIDSLFFFLEIIVGTSVHSLALVADSFHMLNDVFSLVVALYAIRLAQTKATNSKYTYGWQRAEVLGALVNGVFLLALCLSIFLEAIQRLIDPPVITQPVLILGVGTAGLVSNILGLFLFHEHGHSHGGHSHGPESHATHKHTHGEEGHVHADEETNPADESGDIESVLPQTVVGMYPSASARNNGKGRKGSHHLSRSFGSVSRHRHLDDIHVHPAQNRQAINDAANSELDSISDGESSDEGEEDVKPTETSALLNGGAKHKTSHIHTSPHTHAHKHNHTENLLNPPENTAVHKDHIHTKPRTKKSGGHSHENLNMRGVFLHVMGDALGNIGVIASAVFIWKTDYWWRFYSDPVISLVITGIIFASALPLCKSASKILLQAVPNGIDVDDVKRDIMDVPDVVNVHELHIWQLSDTKLVASLHVQIAFNPHSDCHDNTSADPTAQYIALSLAIRTCLHAYGIHSSTIQPEYNPGSATPNGLTSSMASPPADGSAHGSVGPGSKAGSDMGGDATTDVNTCLMECAEECDTGKCCGPTADPKDDSHAGHNH